MVRTLLLGFALVVLVGCGGGNTATVSDDYLNSTPTDGQPKTPAGDGAGDELESPPPPSIDG